MKIAVCTLTLAMLLQWASASAQFERLPDNPIITFDSSPSLGRNINGPSLIKVPEWIPNPLGKYYLYFAHHGGKFIRLAYADSLEGPWSIHEPGTLQMDQVKGLAHAHIASPDIIVDEESEQLLMYYHFPVHKSSRDVETALRHAKQYFDAPIRKNGILAGQYSGVATSKNGIDFEPASGVIAPFYLRVFEHDGQTYGIAKDGVRGGFLMHRKSGDLGSSFEVVKTILPKMRHVAVYVDGDMLYVAYSRTGDAPEHILLSTAHLKGPAESWTFSEPVSILMPEKDWEGANRPNKPSRAGSAKGAVNQLRDPALYVEDDTVYLVYSIAGERGLATAKIALDDFRELPHHNPKM